MIPWAPQFHAPGIHHAMIPGAAWPICQDHRGIITPCPGAWCSPHALCPIATLATGWMWLGEGLLGKTSQTHQGQRAVVGHRVQSGSPAWQALGNGSRVATAAPLCRCPPVTGTAMVGAPSSVPPMRWVPREWVGRHLTHAGAQGCCQPGAWPPQRCRPSQGKNMIWF